MERKEAPSGATLSACQTRMRLPARVLMKHGVVLACFVVLGITTRARADAIYDLKADWSDVNNPNGVGL